jgi:hypothetical protein
MGTKSRETIYGGSIRASAERAAEARKQADRLACEAWNQRMLGFQGPAQPSPALGDALNAGYRYLEVRCLGCDTHQTVALDIVRRPKTTPVHELERYMRCRQCSGVRRYPRINAAKAMAEASGPLNAYADDFLPLIENIGFWSERRHWFAHGFMTIFTAPDGKHAFEFRRYEQQEDGASSFSNGSPPSTNCRTLRTRSTDIAQPSSPSTSASIWNWELRTSEHHPSVTTEQ